MSGVFALFFIFLLFGGFRWLLATFFRGVGAGIDTLSSGGSAEAWRARTFGMGQFETRTRQLPPDEKRSFSVIEIEARGLIPVAYSTNLSFVTTVLDVTDPNNVRPVISAVDEFQEGSSVAYRYTMRPMRVSPNEGFIDWSRVGLVLPEVLTPPRGGARQFEAWIYLVDPAHTPVIQHGFVQSGRPLAAYKQRFQWTFADKGYEETAEFRIRRRPLIIKLAVAVAMSDNSFAEAEGAIIQRWIERQMSLVGDSIRNDVRRDCNEALRSAYAEAQTGALSFSAICNEIVAISDTADRYEAIELCLDVMAADGEAHPAELKLIEQVAAALSLDYHELQRMKDQRLVNVVVSSASEASMEALLGIDAKWPPERIKTHLRDEFRRWNGRLNTLTDPEERANVQARINLISEARKKYAS